MSACGKPGHHLDPGPRPPKHSATPQMVVLSYGYSSTRTPDSGRISIKLSIAAGSRQPLILEKPLGRRGLSVEIQGPNGVVMAAYGMPARITSEIPSGELKTGPLPLDFELALPAAAMCPGRNLHDAVKDSTAPGEGSSTLTVSVRDRAISRHRAAHGIDASSDLLVASWPPDPNSPADGAGTFPEN
ncbi:hypothetical protein [Streptomyces sp. NPDC002994]|uniref:hypothetical protein n=1 Tax=Streptomyces sp. NPDC002994 TaxID=3154441 RepID=UPI0033BA0961